MAHRVGRIGSRQHGVHLGPTRVAEHQPDQEPVPLTVRERRRAGSVERILSGKDKERHRQSTGDGIHAHLVLLHGFEESGLGSGRRPIELVGHEHIGEDGSGSEGRFGPVRPEHGSAHHVGRQEVSRALESVESESQRPGQGLGQGGLAQSGMVLDQEVTACSYTRYGQPDRARCGGDHRRDRGLQGNERGGGLVVRRWIRCVALQFGHRELLMSSRSLGSGLASWSGESHSSIRCSARASSLRASGPRMGSGSAPWAPFLHRGRPERLSAWPARGSDRFATTSPPPSRWPEWPAPRAAPSHLICWRPPWGTAEPTTAPT